jgi:hypothetical protein
VVTIALLQFITNDLLSHRVDFNNGTGLITLGVQRTVAVRATLWPRHRLLAGDLVIGDVAPTVTTMAWLGAPQCWEFCGAALRLTWWLDAAINLARSQQRVSGCTRGICETVRRMRNGGYARKNILP